MAKPILTDGDYKKLEEGGVLLTNPFGLLRVGAEAQAKKIFKWGNEPCPHHKERYLRHNRRNCDLCWRELGKE